MYYERESQSFHATFKDKILSASQRRGAEAPTWEDVLSVSTDLWETRRVLTEQEISTSGLKRDIQYSINFGRPEITATKLDDHADVYSRAVEELRRDIDAYARAQDFLEDSTSQEISEQFLGFLGEYLEDRDRLMNDPQGYEIAQMKTKVLSAILDGFVDQFQPTFEMSEASSLPAASQPLVKKMNRHFTTEVLAKVAEFTLKKGRVIATQDQPLLILDVMDKSGGRISGALTPFQVIDTARKTADPFLKYVLYRNGMIAPDGYEAPCSMPPPTIISHALNALDFAEENRQQTVETSHLLPGLLQDSEVLRLLVDLDTERNISEKIEESPMAILFGRRLGYSRNFIKFYRVVQSSLAPQKEGEDAFRFRPEIDEGLRDFLKKSEVVVTDGPKSLAPARLFGELIKQPEVRKVLFKTGLTARQLNRWPRLLKQATLKSIREEKNVKEQLEKSFKVGDKELEDLLADYGSERTKLALDGKLDPVIGREEEIRKMVRILLQRGKSNPLLLGEAGVGKTILFDGLAQLIASGNVPKSLIGARLFTLDLNSMNSGAMFRGQFEERLLPIVKGVSERNAKGDKPPIILCFDEIHSALMAGTAQGTPGAGELLKPALAKGELSVIGATTQGDYAKYIEVDGALNRRLEPIFIYSPSSEQTVTIVEGLREIYGKYHGIEFPQDLVPTLVRLTDRYLPNLNQPDKAISIFDAAYAHARMHEKERVDQATLIDTIAAAAKLDPKFLSENEGARFLRLKEQLPQEVVGQNEAVGRIAEALIIAKADLHDPKKPLGQFLLMGPTGVGKTETARALARLLFGTEEALIRIDMSNMREAHEDSRMLGAPPGFVGYGEEGELTGDVRRKPYAVVLLDEVEKAHPDVFKRLLPVFEEGEVRDGRNQVISFRNTIILMTTNLGVEQARSEYRNRGAMLKNKNVPWRKVTYPEFEKAAKEYFPPEFLNRLDAQIIYDPLSQEVIHQLVGREIEALAKRLEYRWGLKLDVSQSVYDQLAKDGYNDEYGARYLKRTITSQLVTPLSAWILANESGLYPSETIEITELGTNFSPGISQSA